MKSKLTDDKKAWKAAYMKLLGLYFDAKNDSKIAAPCYRLAFQIRALVLKEAAKVVAEHGDLK